MPELRVRRNKNTGEQSYFDINSASWLPLEDGITSFQDEEGNPHIWSNGRLLPQETYTDILKRGTNAAVESGRRLLHDAVGIGDEQWALEQQPLFNERETARSPEFTQAMNNYAEDTKDSGTLGRVAKGVGTILSNPLDVGGPMLAESIPSMLPAAVGALGGAALTGGASVPATLAVMGAGTAAGSVTATYGSKYNDLLRQAAGKAGVNVNDPAALAKFGSDPLVSTMIREQAAKYTAPIAALDAVSSGLAMRSARLAENAATTLSKAGVLGAGTVQQAAAGMGGEALGQVWGEGKITDPVGVAAEGALEAFTGVPEILTVGSVTKPEAPVGAPAHSPYLDHTDGIDYGSPDLVKSLEEAIPKLKETEATLREQVTMLTSRGASEDEIAPYLAKQERASALIKELGPKLLKAKFTTLINDVNPVNINQRTPEEVAQVRERYKEVTTGEPYLKSVYGKRGESIALPETEAVEGTESLKLPREQKLEALQKFTQKNVETKQKRLDKVAAQLEEARSEWDSADGARKTTLGKVIPRLEAAYDSLTSQVATGKEEIKGLLDEIQRTKDEAADWKEHQDWMLQQQDEYLTGKDNEKLAARLATDRAFIEGQNYNEYIARQNEEAQLEQEADEKVQLIRKNKAMANVLTNYSTQDWFNKLDDTEVKEIVESLKDYDLAALEDMAARDLSQGVRTSKKRTTKSAPIPEPSFYRRAQVNDGTNTQQNLLTDEDYVNNNYKVVKEILKALNLLDKLNVKLVYKDLLNNGRDRGFSVGDRIVLAAIAPEERVIETLNHEVIHSLRNLGLFSPKEWESLANAALKGKWLDRFNIDKRYADEPFEIKLEEAIAEYFAKVHAAPNNSLLHKVLKRIRVLLNYVRKALGGSESFRGVFDKILSGEVGARNSKYIFNDPEDRLILDNETNVMARTLRVMRQGTENSKKTLQDMYTASIEGNKEAHAGWLAPWWKDVQQMARQIPLLRDFASTLARRSELSETERRTALAAIRAVSLAHKTPAEKKVINAANTGYMYLYANQDAFPELSFNSNNQRATLTLNQNFLGLGRKGDTISIGPEEYKLMQSTRDYFKGALERKSLSTVTTLLDEIFLDAPTASIQLLNSPKTKGNIISALKDIGDYMEKVATTGLKDASFQYNDIYEGIVKELPKEQDLSKIALALRNASDIMKAAVREVEVKGVYLPAVRPSKSFLYVYDRSKPITDPEALKKIPSYKEPYEVIGVVPVPSTLIGKKPSAKQLGKFMADIHEEFKQTSDVTNIHVGNPTDISNRSNVGSFLRESSFTLFDKLDMLADLKLSGQDSRNIINELNDLLRLKGFEAHFLKSKRLPGHINKTTKENYVPLSISNYGNGLANSYAKALTQADLSKAIQKVYAAVQKGEADGSVADYVDNTMKEINAPSNTHETLRAIGTHYFLGFNVSSGLLQLLQGPQASMPVLSAMFGSPLKVMSALSSGYKSALTLNKNALLNLNPTQEDALSGNITKLFDDPKSKYYKYRDVFYNLYSRGKLFPVIADELTTNRYTHKLGLTAGNREITQGFADFVDKATHSSLFLLSRLEAANRLAAMFAAFDMYDKAMKTDQGKARLRKFLDRFGHNDTHVTDRESVISIALDTSQFDNSRFNRARMFRGALAVPFQFMAFPLKYLGLYLDMFKAALGDATLRDPRTWGKMDKDFISAVSIMVLSLWATSGLFGAIPLGDPLRDAYDKLYRLATGIDPDFESQFRGALVNSLGASPYVAELIARGPVPSIAKRTGVGVFSGASTEGSLFDLFGPTGSLVTTIEQVNEQYQQGNKALAMSLLMPAIIRNFAKAYAGSEGTLKTQAGNVIPTDFTTTDTLLQALGFSPNNLVRTRNSLLAADRLSKSSSVLKERLQDNMVTLLLDRDSALRKGDRESANEYMNRVQELMKQAISFDKENPLKRMNIRFSSIIQRLNLQRRAQEGITKVRGASMQKEALVKSEINQVYPQGYTR